MPPLERALDYGTTVCDCFDPRNGGDQNYEENEKKTTSSWRTWDFE